MQFFKDLFKSKKTIEEEYALRLETDRAKRESEEAELRVRLENERLANLRSSSAPWCEPIPNSEDKIHVGEKFHWNDAFIKDLKRQGLKGDSDAALIQAWINKEEEDKRQAIIEEERAKKRAGKEPYVEVIGESFDENGDRFALTLDWNAPFIHMLRVQGFRGATDEQVVQHWLTNLQKDGEEYA